MWRRWQPLAKRRNTRYDFGRGRDPGSYDQRVSQFSLYDLVRRILLVSGEDREPQVFLSARFSVFNRHPADVRTDGRTYGRIFSPSNIIRSTFGSRPNNIVPTFTSSSCYFTVRRWPLPTQQPHWRRTYGNQQCTTVHSRPASQPINSQHGTRR